MRAMPPGFAYGIGPNSPVPPGEDQEIGLTVAGIAACPDTSEILSVFLEFIQMATITEKGWLPTTGDPATQPTLTDADFAARARTLPAAGRAHLLQLLFLIIKTEGAGWAGLSADPATGHWAVAFSRQIRDFANVRDMGDYWARRYKPWEPGRPASATTAPASTAPAPAGDSRARSDETTSRSAVGNTATVRSATGGQPAPGGPARSCIHLICPRGCPASGPVAGDLGTGRCQGLA